MSGVFRVERQDDGTAHLVADHPSRKLNVLDLDALASLESALTTLEAAPPRGLLVRSAKPGSFIAGADLGVLARVTSEAEVEAYVRRGQAAYARLAALSCPTLAVIDGVCLGGGLELALACDSRLAADEPRTRIGLPEVQLGLLPAWGGTTRLPRLVGVPAALDLILAGRQLDARRAEKLGLVARAVPAAWLDTRARDHLEALIARPAERRRDRHRPRTVLDAFLSGTTAGRALALSQARRGVLARTGGRYPAPLAVIDVLDHTLGRPLEEGFAAEARQAPRLICGDVCKNLVRIFQMSEDAKRAPVVNDASLRAAEVRHLVVAGGGVMGAGIAELAARQGVRVRLREVRPEALQKAMATVYALARDRARRRREGARGIEDVMSRLSPTLELTGLAHADFAIEVVVEDPEVKRRVFAELEVRVPPTALLATNTSSLSVDALAEGLRHPERFVGFHFFNPVHRMPLVEVVRGARTSDAALVSAVGFARRLGKTPVVVKDSPGFVVNRVLMPYLREALHLLEEGYTVRDLDAAMRRFGMPMGPFEVLDEVGLDVAAKAAGVLTRAFPTRMTTSAVLDRMVEAGRLGRKTGRGFLLHRGRRRRADETLGALLRLPAARRPASLEPLAERMALAMVNESARCLEEGIVDGPEAIDLALVFGAGFPPFRGGPLRHADEVGVERVVERLRALAAEQGPRFEPCALLVERAARRVSLTR